MSLLRTPILLFLLSLAVGWGVYAASAPPAPVPATAPADEFSAGRAESILSQLYEGMGPHVAGSEANATLRDRILTVLEASGYRPEVQRRYDCNPMFATCSPVENIVAVLEGEHAGGPAILLTSHYDSTWAGPAVADAGAGVAAVLEIARLAAAAPKFRHDLVFLITDGEEQGLNGAHAFATANPLFPRVRAVINLEARGVTGSSAMFETGDGNRGLIRLLAKHLERPVANSLTWEMYRRMPNDTDFSVYRPYPVTGYNFAFTEGVAVYHSAIDDLAHLDRGSLQHHGQNAWSMLRAMDRRTLEHLVSSENAVYVDVFGRSLLHYPESTAAGLALVIGVLVLVAIRRSHARAIELKQLAWSILAILGLLLAVPAAGWLLSWPLGRWPDLHGIDHPYPWTGRLVLVVAAAGITYRVASWLTARASSGAAMMASWGVCTLLALGLATTLPAASFVPLLPLTAFMFGLVPDALRRHSEPKLAFAGLRGFLAALYVGFYLTRMLETIANFDQSALRMLPLAIPAIAALPLLLGSGAGREKVNRVMAGFGILVLAGCIAQWLIPAYTPDRPRDMAVYYREDPGGQNAYMVLESVHGAVDRDYAEAHGFTAQELAGADGTPRELLVVAAEPLMLPAVGVSASRGGEDSDGAERWLLDVELPEGLRQLVITLPEGDTLKSAELAGQSVFDASREAHRPRDDRQRLLLHEPPPGEARLALELVPGASAVRELVIAARFDLPPERLEPFRAGWPNDAQPAFRGPRAVVYSRLALAGGSGEAAGGGQAMTR